MGTFRVTRWGVLLLAVAATTGCATTHTAERRDFMSAFVAGDLEDADEILRTSAGTEEKNFLVDVADRSMVLHRLGRYDESNQYLEKADQKIEEYFTTRVSDVLAALAWNDTAATYKGEDFERVMIDVLQAFNYLATGRQDEALVEARQVDRKLEAFSAMLRDHGVTTGYVSDPFAQYVAGLVQESGGDFGTAYLDYAHALADYEALGRAYGVSVPEDIVADAARAAALAGRTDDLQRLLAQLPESQRRDATSGQRSEIVVIVGLGQVVHKESQKWVTFDGQDTLAVTYPEFVATASRVAGAEVQVDREGTPVPTRTVYSLSTVATGVLRERNEAVREKAIREAIVRFAAKKASRAVAEASSNSYVKLGAALFNVATTAKELSEVADTRSWRTLPDRYAMLRIPVRPGLHDVDVRFVDASGRAVDVQPCRVFVGPGSKGFVILHSNEGAPVRVAGPAPRYFGPTPVPQLDAAALAWTAPAAPVVASAPPSAPPASAPPVDDEVAGLLAALVPPVRGDAADAAPRVPPDAPSELPLPALPTCASLQGFAGDWQCGAVTCPVVVDDAGGRCVVKSPCAPTPLSAVSEGVCGGDDGAILFLRSARRLDWSTAKGTFTTCRRAKAVRL